MNDIMKSLYLYIHGPPNIKSTINKNLYIYKKKNIMDLYGYKYDGIDSDDNNLFYILLYLEIYGLALEFVSDEFKTPEICFTAVNSNGLSLEFVPTELKTKELCLIAINLNGLSLEFVPTELKTSELCLIAINLNGLSLEFVPTELKTKELCLIAINLNGLSLEFVPEKFITEDLYLKAVKSNGLAFNYIPKHYQQISLLEISLKNFKVINDITQYPHKYLNEIIVYLFNEKKIYNVLTNIEQSYNSDIIIQNILKEPPYNKFKIIPEKLITLNICMYSIVNNYVLLIDIPLKFKTFELCNEAVNHNSKSLLYVPKHLITIELCNIAVRHHNIAIQYIPNDIIIQHEFEYIDLCHYVLDQNGISLQYIPIKYRTIDICIYAINKNVSALQYVPNPIITQELCDMAISLNDNPENILLQYVPDQFKTYDMCLDLVRQNYKSLQYVPDKFKISELCIIAIKQNEISLEYIPDKLRTYELCYLAVSQNSRSFIIVPTQIITQELCNIAITQNIDHTYIILRYVPTQFKTHELCYHAVKQNWMALRYVDIALQTSYIIKEAILQDNKACHYILSDYDISNCKSSEYNKKYLVTLNKIEKILNAFSKKECFIDLNHPKIIEIDENTYYYSSLNIIHDSDYLNYFKDKYYCWSTNILEQSLLHLFNAYRKPVNIDLSSLIQPITCQFKLKKCRIIDSDNSCNDNIFQGILNDNIIKLIEIILFSACEKAYEPPKVEELKLFQRENNKYILYILELLNRKLDRSEYIYGYYNRYDQNEMALINFNNIINIDTLKCSKILSITYNKSIDDNIIFTFPLTEDIYKRLCKLVLVAYITDKYGTIEDKNSNCALKYKMIFHKNSIIEYENFDDFSIIDRYDKYIPINSSTPEYIDYFKKKYLKYKKKYLKYKKNI